MRAVTALFACVAILLTGCSNTNTTLDKATALRDEIERSEGCGFLATVTADYGDSVYTFSMDCTTDKEGNLTFAVTSPDTIAGITGKVSAAGGELTFDDKVLAFQTLRQRQLLIMQ